MVCGASVFRACLSDDAAAADVDDCVVAEAGGVD